MAQLIKTDGTTIEVEPKNGTDFTLDELRELIGCDWIEVVRCRKDGMILIVDEEGRLNLKDRNRVASALTFFDIVGNAVYCSIRQLR